MTRTRLMLASSLVTCEVMLVAGLVGPRLAEASVVQYDSRSTFDASGGFIPVRWGVFGPAGTTISTPDTRLVDGLVIGVASSQGVLARQNEGDGFTGDFAAGAHLLTDGGSESDNLIVRFAIPVTGFGTQIDPHYITGGFSGEVDVFSITNTLLYEADFSGIATTAENNSAPFVGVESSLADIGYAEFWINQTTPGLPARSGALTINRLDVVDPVSVPEPPSAVVILTGLLAISLYRRHKA